MTMLLLLSSYDFVVARPRDESFPGEVQGHLTVESIPILTILNQFFEQRRVQLAVDFADSVHPAVSARIA